MKAMKTNLKDLNVPNDKIHQEAFSMSPKLPLRENIFNIFFVTSLTVVLFVVFLNYIQTSAKKSSTESSENVKKNNLLKIVNNFTLERKNILEMEKQEAVNIVNSKTAKSVDQVAPSASTTEKELVEKAQVKNIKPPVNISNPKTTTTKTVPTITKPVVPTRVIPKPSNVTPTPVLPKPASPAPVIEPDVVSVPVDTVPKPTTQVS